MKSVKIFDTTLRDGEQSPGCTMNLEEKMKLARQLDLLGVNVIEAGFAAASNGDFESIKAIAGVVKEATVASLCRANIKDIDRAFEAVKNARNPRIHTFIATSPIHMKYKLKMTEDEVYDKAVEMVKYAKKLCDDIEFSAEDASRSDYDFLKRVYQGVIDAGATTINVPDTVGYTTPEEIFTLVSSLKKDLKGIEKVDISVHCHNDLGLAVSNSLAAVRGGATQVECTVNGIGERAGNTALEEVVMALNVRKDYFGKETTIDTTKITNISKLLSNIVGFTVQPNKAIVGANAFAHEAGIHQHGMLQNSTTYEIMTPESVGLKENKLVLGKHSGKHAFEDALSKLGYKFEKDELVKYFVKFKDLLDKKKKIYESDLIAIVMDSTVEANHSYKLKEYVISSSNKFEAVANISIDYDTEILRGVASGDGPVDAGFNAIKIATKTDLTLKDYRINSISEGTDAQGEAFVRLDGISKSYYGKGVSTDVIEASMKAYLNATDRYMRDIETTCSKKESAS